jgi:predicted dehydrogenase
MKETAVAQIGIGMIGTGGIALANHLPGFSYCPDTKVVALCDANPQALEKARQQTGITAAFTDYHQLLARPDVHAVVIATPNNVHAPITLAAAAAGKHILCEKPIAMDYAQSLKMLAAAQSANVRHMTAFTYRFVPDMRYMAHLVKRGDIGKPYHFRVNRFQDWGDRYLGWRQSKKTAATGEMGDMLSHRIDYGHSMLGPVKRVMGFTKRFIDVRGGQPADVEDWVGAVGEFEVGATANFESTKLATGRGEGGKSQDYCEVNGSEGSLVYYLATPLELLVGRKGGSGLEKLPVPAEFLKVPSSTRDPKQGDPGVTFRYDQDAEFIDAIRNGRMCAPSFVDGARVQAVMEAILVSENEGRWVEVKQP